MSTIERSHGKRRLTRPRLSDLAVTPEHERHRDRDEHGRFLPGNRAGVGRTAVRALTRELHAIAALMGAATASAAQTDSDVAMIAKDVLSLYVVAKRRLADDSPLVLAPALAWARNSVLARYYGEQAIVAGLDTTKGRALIEMAHKCEQRAERSEVAALALAEKLADARRGASADDDDSLFYASEDEDNSDES